MQQEARNTEGQSRNWSRSRLRHKSVNFVKENNGPLLDNARHQARPDRPSEQPDKTSLPSPTESSDDEQIVFRGRKWQGNGNNPKPVPPTEGVSGTDHAPDGDPDSGPDQTVETDLPEEDARHFAPRLFGISLGPVELDKTTEPTTAQVDLDRIHVGTEEQERPPSFLGSTKSGLSSEVDTLADYIANIDPDYVDSGQSSEEAPDGDTRAANDIRPQSLALSSDYSTNSQSNHDDQISSLDDSSEYSRAKLYDDFGILYEGEVVLDSLNEYEPDEKAGDLGCPRPARGISRKKKKSPFMSASSFADALEDDPYYGLDIMDFDRPSLRQKAKKGKQALPIFGLSDSELECELQETWENNRKKKGSKKRMREELRAQGLLGRGSGSAPDLKTKYSRGMEFNDLKQELLSFLLSSKSR